MKAKGCGWERNVLETRQTGRVIDAVCGGENTGLTACILAMTITTTHTVVFTGSHCFEVLPRLRCEGVGVV